MSTINPDPTNPTENETYERWFRNGYYDNDYYSYLDDWAEEMGPVEDTKLTGRRLRRDRQREINWLAAQFEAEAMDYYLDVLLTKRLEAKSHPAARVLRDGWSVPGKPRCRRNNRRGTDNAKPISRKSWQSIRTFHRP